MAERVEDKDYADLVAAEEEVQKILAQMDQVIKSAASREAGEKLVLEKYAPLMDQAMKKSRAALDVWLREGQALLQEGQTLLQEEV